MNNVFTAKTIEDAINEGIKALGLTRETAEWSVLEEPKKGGILGIGSKPAKVRVIKKKTQIELTIDFLDGLFTQMKINATTDVSEETESRVVINLITTDSSQVIGYRGEVLDSIQAMASAVYNGNKENFTRVIIDCEGYREKREQSLQNLALKLAQKAVKTSRKVVLEPMNPFERRIIHSALIEFEGVKTVSEGREPNRYIAIIPDGYVPHKSNDKFGAKRGGGKEKGKERRSNSNHRGGDRKPAPRAKTSFGGAVFLGNSLKENNND